MNSKAKLVKSFGIVLIGSLAACSQPDFDPDVLEPICLKDETKDWLLDNDIGAVVDIQTNNALIGYPCVY